MSLIPTILCDSCGTHYMLEVGMDLPPKWFVIHMAVSDSEGIIPPKDNDNMYLHFCSQPCLVQFMQDATLVESILSSNNSNKEEEEEDE